MSSDEDKGRDVRAVAEHQRRVSETRQLPRRPFSPTKPQRPVIAGRLHHHETGYPLAGVAVKVDLTMPPGRPRAIGSAVTDVAGRFSVVPRREALDALRLIGQRGVALVLTAGPPERPWRRTEDLSRSVGGLVVLSIPVPPDEPSTQHWADFARSLTERQHTRLHEALRHLVLAEDGDSVVGGWPLTLRHSMALALEMAFLDPRGVLTAVRRPPTFFQVHAEDAWENYQRVVQASNDPEISVALDRAAALYASYPGAYRADWEMDLEAMAQNDLGVAASKFEDLYNQGLDTWTGTIPVPVSPLVPYRDYLRALFTGSDNSDAESQVKLGKLANRFHQN